MDEDDLLDYAYGPPSRALAAPEPVCWRYLSTEEASAELEPLGEFVDWLVDRYCLDHKTVPPCWAQHGALIEELSALHGAWQVAFLPTNSAAGPADFHTVFAYARQRLTEWASRRGCRASEHRPDP